MIFNLSVVWGIFLVGIAQTTLAVAVEPELKLEIGRQFDDCKLVLEFKASQDDEVAGWLWKDSAKLSNLAE